MWPSMAASSNGVRPSVNGMDRTGCYVLLWRLDMICIPVATKPLLIAGLYLKEHDTLENKFPHRCLNKSFLSVVRQ